MLGPKPKFRAGLWVLGAFVASLLLAVIPLQVDGTAAPGTLLGLKLTARWAYVFFWLAYVGGPMAALFGSRFEPLARRARELGLAFVAAMVPHTALVAWIFYISPTPPMTRAKAVFFLIALAFAYALALLSFRQVSARLAPSTARRLRVVGVEYIALAFLRDFIGVPAHPDWLQRLAYVPFIGLAIAAALLRLTRLAVGARQRTHAAAPTPRS